MSTDPDDGIDFGAHDSPELNLSRPDQARDLSANRSRARGMYLPIDPTIPRPDHYGALSTGDLLLVCEYWRFAALHWLRREKPDEFHQRFGSLVGRRDPASRYMRTLITTGGEVDSASSPYFFPEFQFAELTEIIVRACGDSGLDPQPIHEFLRYPDADLKDAIRAVERLERYLSQAATIGAPPSGQPSEKRQGARDAGGGMAPISELGSKKLPERMVAKEISEFFDWPLGRVRSELSKAYYGPDGAKSGRPAPGRAFWRDPVPYGGGSKTSFVWITRHVIPHLKTIFKKHKQKH